MFTAILIKILSFFYTAAMQSQYVRVTAVAAICATTHARGQGISYRVNNGAGTGEWYRNSDNKVYGRVDTTQFSFQTSFMYLPKIALRNDTPMSADSSGLLWASPNGNVNRTTVSTFFTNSNMAAYGIMSAQRATDSITNIKAMIGASLDTTAAKLLYYPLSLNPANYLQTINSSQIISALGYTPYNSTNPNGFITVASIAGKADTGNVYTRGVSDARFQPVGSYATTAQVNSKINIADSAAMLSTYLRKIDTTGKWISFATAASLYQPIGSYATTSQLALKVNIADTLNMLSSYLRKVDTATLSNRINANSTSISSLNSSVATKLNITDTTGRWLTPASAALYYQPIGSYATTTQLNTKLTITDTTGKWLTPASAALYYQPIGSYATTSQLATKVAYADTAAMLLNYKNNISTNTANISTNTASISSLNSTVAAKLNATDTASLSNRINAKQNTLTLTTTGSGASSLTGATLNIPIPAATDSTVFQTKYRSDTARTNTYATIAAKGNGTVTSVGITSTDFAVSGSPVTSSGNITANLNTSGITAGTYNASVTYNNKGIATAGTNASFNTTPARTLSTTGSNNTFTISASKNARAHYTINFAYALTLTTSNGYVELDYSLDGGTTWITCGSVSSVYSVSVTLTGNTDAELTGEIPAGALVRLYRINATNCTITLPTTKQLEITY